MALLKLENSSTLSCGPLAGSVGPTERESFAVVTQACQTEGEAQGNGGMACTYASGLRILAEEIWGWVGTEKSNLRGTRKLPFITEEQKPSRAGQKPMSWL